MHMTAVERTRSQLSGDNIMVCIRDDNYLNYSYPTELWITRLVLLTLVNQTPVFIHILTNAIRSMQFWWITTTYTQHPSWATFPHFLTEPASLANHAINTVCCFNTQATPPLYHVDLIVSLDIHPWRSRACKWLHPRLRSAIPAWTLPSFPPACYDFSCLRDPGVGHFSMSFLCWIVYCLPYVPFFCCLSSPKLPGSPQHHLVQPRACSTAAVCNQPCGPRTN